MRLRLADDERLRRALIGFSRETEFVVSELPMTAEQRAGLSSLFDEADDPWMIYDYLVTSAMWHKVQEVMGCGPPDPAQVYYVSCWRVKVNDPDGRPWTTAGGTGSRWEDGP